MPTFSFFSMFVLLPFLFIMPPALLSRSHFI